MFPFGDKQVRKNWNEERLLYESLEKASFPSDFPIDVYHHIRLIGCSSPASLLPTWSVSYFRSFFPVWTAANFAWECLWNRDCDKLRPCGGHMYSAMAINGGDGRQGLYPVKTIGYKAGGDTQIKYLVMSVHYENKRGESPKPTLTFISGFWPNHITRQLFSGLGRDDVLVNISYQKEPCVQRGLCMQ